MANFEPKQPPINAIAEKIIDAFHPVRIIMFGSRARGEPGWDSDIDLMIEMESTLSAPQRAMAVDALFGPREWSMDVLVYTPAEVRKQRTFRNALLRVIESEGTVLYERPR